MTRRTRSERGRRGSERRDLSAAPRDGGRKKRDYTRRGPVGVVQQNVARAHRHASLAARRLVEWAAGGDPRAVSAREAAERTRREAEALVSAVERLAASGYEPPPRPAKKRLAVGDLVSIRPERRARYEDAYAQVLAGNAGYLDELAVDRELDDGSLLVARAGCVPFPARRSHLARRAG